MTYKISTTKKSRDNQNYLLQVNKRITIRKGTDDHNCEKSQSNYF